MTDILHRYYGDFDLINEKWNEDYESILIKPKDDQEYKRCRLAKKTPKKEGYFTVFWKKDQDNKNIPYTDKDLGNELIIVINQLIGREPIFHRFLFSSLIMRFVNFIWYRCRDRR